MTPVICITFLLSLAVVDWRNTAKRSQYHADDPPLSWMPRWLRGIFYHETQPAGEQDQSERDQATTSSQLYYHSKQRKLMRMEAAEAFEMRGWVVVVLGLSTAFVCLAMYRVALWVLSAFF